MFGLTDLAGAALAGDRRGKMRRHYSRADAAFACPEVHGLLQAEDCKYTIRLAANPILR